MSVSPNIGRMIKNAKKNSKRKILRHHLEDTHMDGRIILKRILEKWNPG